MMTPVESSRAQLAGTIVAALSTAALALVVAIGAEVAFQWDLSTAVSHYAATHPGLPYSAFCGYANGNIGIGNQWLFLGPSAVLLLGGIACISLALLRRSRGSRRRRLAIAAGATEVGLSLVVLGLSYVWLTASALSCLD